MSGGGNKPDQPLVSFLQYHVWDTICDTKVGELNLPHIPQMWHFFTAAVPQRTATLNRHFSLGRREEDPPTGRSGGEGGVRNGARSLSDPPLHRLLLQVHW